jgi:hypothetical protein
MTRRTALLVCVVVAAVAGFAPASARADGWHTCRGTFASPGVLSGSYSNVVVHGVCSATAATTVNGKLVIARHSTLMAFVDLTVTRDVRVHWGGTLVAGADPDQGGSPGQSSFFHVQGNLRAWRPLGVVIHGGRVDGYVRERGGGGGVTCEPRGIFAKLGSPVFSVYEGMEIDGTLSVSRLHSCWFGITHNTQIGGVRVTRNQLADPDAIEILDNTIERNLVCRHNSMMWDSADTVEGSLYPRQWEPNRVGGRRVGECVAAPPLTQDGSSPGPF